MGADGEVIRLPLGLRIPLTELDFEVSRASGPGGQNVNKVNSRVSLRFDVLNSPSLPDRPRQRLLEGLKSRLTTEGVLVLHSSEYREQARNRAAAILRFENLLRELLTPKKQRRPTRPTRGSVERRIKERKLRGQIKKWRRKPKGDE